LYVIGNGSVDYDSFFGSIVLAYILTEASGFLHVPLIDCSRSDLNLRFEIIAVLDKLKINPNVFQFRSNPTEPYPKGKFSLYDHNEREDLKEELSYIVDHHAYSIEKVAKTKHLINQMGSALTILYDLLNPASIN
jgi:inorganic pyrophosphatase/exopolyphosphatase